jgi:eukaryotic-like serine/threonine-protein kinase
MALEIGTRFGPYEVLAPAGAGGMGEVYRARDTRLDRIVALKVLPSHLAANAALRERFEREARAISHLNHPNICTLHDVGSADGVGFLVMEFLEGETLMQRLGRGPLALGPALQIAIQIAEALDRAHRAGIVHRDLKPSNVFLVRSAGASSTPLVKLLDFGLAKSTAPMTPGLPASPTVGVLTGEGTILGTLQYMAPEQLEGKETDHRVDVFAFGAVLHELLTGTAAFRGASQASLIASILTSEPTSVSSLQPVTPPILDHLVSRSLAKDPNERWTSMHDVWLQLRWIATQPLAPPATAVAAPLARRERRWWMAAIASLLLAAATAAVWLWRPITDVPPQIQFEIHPPDGTTFQVAGLGIINMTPALSHDGSAVIIPATGTDGVRRLWLRRLDSATIELLSGTDNGFLPFWSADDRSIAFFADGRLQRLDLGGGAPRILCDAPSGLGGTWNRDDVIVFSPAAGLPLHRVSASGGLPSALTTLDKAREHYSHRFPSFLPDGRHFLYLARSAKSELSAVLVGSLDSAATTTVMASTLRAQFVPPRWLAFQSGTIGGGGSLLGTLFLQPFDPDRRELTGERRALRQNVVVDEGGHGGYSFSDRGTIAYRAISGSRQDTLNWFKRSGAFETTIGEPGDYTVPRLSPDGRKLAVAMNGAIWVRDLVRGTAARLTSGPAHCCPAWAPDGSRIAFRNGVTDIGLIAASGTGGHTVLLANGASNTPTHWTPDGRAILYQSIGPNRIDTLLLPLAEPRTPKLVLQSQFNEEQAQLSRDGRWIAYASDESGRPQVYVQDFPALTQKWLISANGGADPQWRADGGELFFLAPDHKLMAVPIKRDTTFEPGIPLPLFQTRVTGLTDVRTHYQVSADGQRFLVNTVDAADRGAPIQVVVNWQAAQPK